MIARAGYAKMLSDQTAVFSTTTVANVETRRTMVVSLAEAKLLERIRACTTPTVFMLYAGGDGEPKQLFAHEDVKREDLTR